MYILFVPHSVADFIITSRSVQGQRDLFTFRRHSPEMCPAPDVLEYISYISFSCTYQSGYFRQTTSELLSPKYTLTTLRVQLHLVFMECILLCIYMLKYIGNNRLTTMLRIILRQVYDVVTCFYSYIATCFGPYSGPSSGIYKNDGIRLHDTKD
jgi:hypothetical protein